MAINSKNTQSLHLVNLSLLVPMRMTVELCSNDIVESVDNATILSRPELEAATTTSWYVGQDMHSLIASLSIEKSVVEPLLPITTGDLFIFRTRTDKKNVSYQSTCNLCAAVHYPPIVDVTVIVV